MPEYPNTLPHRLVNICLVIEKQCFYIFGMAIAIFQPARNFNNFIEKLTTMSWIDNAFGIHAEALKLRTQRAEILSRNIANGDTPGFKARDIDFRAALSNAQHSASSRLEKSQPAHMSVANSSSMGELLYRMPLKSSINGNTVESEVEQAEFTKNAVNYQASLRFLDGSIKGLMLAIRGD